MVKLSFPLCVDLDGTLLATDSFHEACVASFKRKPSSLLQGLLWLLRGKGYLKTRMHELADLPVDTLPLNTEFTDFLRSEAKKGRRIVLVTGAPQDFAERMADRLGFFSDVHGSSESVNLTGERKRKFLQKMFGKEGYAYAGNAHADLPVWRSAESVIVVSPQRGVLLRLRGMPVEKVFYRPTSALGAVLRAMRVHQWMKNLLLFVPLIAAHRFFEGQLWAESLVAFVSFSFGASSMYLLNDLLDLASDRMHPEKRNRPLSAGSLGIVHGVMLFFCCFLASIALSTLLSREFSGILSVYLFAAFVYSSVIKKIPVLDVVVLASMYTLRILAGGMATDIPVSFWLLTWSNFLFLSIASLKRYSDLLLLDTEKGIPGRGYMQGDRQAIFAFGICGGLLSVLLFSLYLNSPDVGALYTKPAILWLACPVLFYWIGRLWFLANRGEIKEDPFLFITRDAVSYVVVSALLMVMVLAI